jgi:Chemoreceptor zinc-binding domain
MTTIADLKRNRARMHADVAPTEQASLEQIIVHALSTHAEWKKRLHTAIATGTCDVSIESAAADDHCEFGRWLHRDVPWTERKTWDYANVRRRHATLHTEAGHVLELALGGYNATAAQMMAPNAPFVHALERFEFGLRDWLLTLASAQAEGSLL